MTDNKDQPGDLLTSAAGDGPADEDECTDCVPRSRRDDYEFTGCGCGDCDSASLEILCRAEGIKARAAYDAAHTGAPSPELYESARLRYGQSRYAVAPRLDDLQVKLDDAMHEIRCRIDDEDKVACLTSAWKEVRRRLQDCHPDECCVDPYEFHVGSKDAQVEDLRARVARYASVTEAAECCFRRLAKEPELLVSRVDALTAEIDAIHLALHPDEAPTPAKTEPAAPVADVKAAGGEGATAGSALAQAAPAADPEPDPEAPNPDWQHVYADALVAKWRLKNVYWGFDDPKEYVDCLCQAMKVAMAGHQILAELHGELRVREARWEQRNQCCRRLREHAANEIISGYVRCIREGCEPEEPEDSDDDDDEDCDDEDCDDETHHHKRHRPRRDRRHSRRRDDYADDDVDVRVRVDVEIDDDDDDDDDDDRHPGRGGHRHDRHGDDHRHGEGHRRGADDRRGDDDAYDEDEDEDEGEDQESGKPPPRRASRPAPARKRAAATPKSGRTTRR